MPWTFYDKNGNQKQASSSLGPMQLLCSQILGAPAAIIDTISLLPAGIPQNFTHLRVIVRGRGDQVTTSIAVRIRFNNDSGANYYDSRLFSSATAQADQALGATVGRLGYLAAAQDPATYGGLVDALIPMYAESNWAKQYISQGYFQSGNNSGNPVATLTGGQWSNAAPITRIQILPELGNFLAGTGFYLYGIGDLNTLPSGLVPVGAEVAYAEMTAAVSGVVATTEGAAVTLITAPSFVADGVSAYFVEVFFPFVQNSVAGAQDLTIVTDGATILGRVSNPADVSGSGGQCNFRRKIVLSAGSHTLVVKGLVTGSTGTWQGNPGGSGAYIPAYIRVTKAS
jgi:hypothetical protein